MFEINGKVALVTGGVKGIGLAIAQELLKNGLKGVSLVDIDAIDGENIIKELCKQYGASSAIFIKADITNDLELEGAFETTVKTFKQLDIVVNNAGISQEIQWQKCIAVNLLATISGSMLAMERYLPQFKHGNEGVLINIASLLGLQPIEETPVYVATKSGVIGFSKSIGGPVHYENHKVRVLTICPGLTSTTMPGLRQDQQHEPYRTRMNNFIAMLQSQSAEDVAKNVIPILQEAASGSVWTVVKGNRALMEFPTIEE